MSLRLKCTDGPLRGQLFDLATDAPFLLGRETLPSKTVSRHHARIDYDGNQFRIVDLKSSNGIRLNRSRVEEAVIKPGDLLQIGEFSFLVEGHQDTPTDPARDMEKTPRPVSKTTRPTPSVKTTVEKVKEKGRVVVTEARERFLRLDISQKILILLIIVGLAAHWVVATSLIEESRASLLDESYGVAREVVRSLGDRNRTQLKEHSAILLDCNFVRKTPGVVDAFILDSQGKVICPVSSSLDEDSVTRSAVMRGEEIDNCRLRVTDHDLPTCDLIFPVRDWNQEKSQFETIGFSRIEYRPAKVEEALQNLQSIRWKTLFLSLALLLVVWWLLRIWLARGAQTVAEGLRMAYSGNVQSLEKIESFAALDPVIDELNRLISKGNQGLRADSPAAANEASFLQSLFHQVLLLEERPVLVVDRENQLLAATATLASVVPIDVERINSHITDIVADTHLQTELMTLLNDLSVSGGVIDRALTMADRVIQVRGLPLILNENYVASVLVF